MCLCVFLSVDFFLDFFLSFFVFVVFVGSVCAANQNSKRKTEQFQHGTIGSRCYQVSCEQKVSDDLRSCNGSRAVHCTDSANY